MNIRYVSVISLLVSQRCYSVIAQFSGMIYSMTQQEEYIYGKESIMGIFITSLSLYEPDHEFITT